MAGRPCLRLYARPPLPLRVPLRIPLRLPQRLPLRLLWRLRVPLLQHPRLRTRRRQQANELLPPRK